MHLETLKVFCDVVETKSFSVAASQNYVTQSAVSQQIRMLEERYGKQLLERTRGNVQLTPAGRELRGRALQALEAADRELARLIDPEDLDRLRRIVSQLGALV